VQTIDYTASATRSEYPRCGRARHELLGGTGTDGAPVFPGAAGILVDTPVAPGVMVSLDAVAATTPLRTVNPGWARYDTLTYRPAVRAGEMLYGSGFGALDPVTQRALHGGDLAAQASYIYASIEEVLSAAGTNGTAVRRLVEYVTPAGAAAYPSLTALRERHFPAAAVTSVVCSGLLRPEFLLETIPTAVLP
jgi:enamine deaminase RidA (YjgF/YER057c/UK114 family)